MSLGRLRAGAAAAAVLMVPALSPTLGCAVLGRGKTLDLQLYTPERIHPDLGSTEMQSSCELRLASVTSGANLGPGIAFGDGLYRVRQYEGLRWTERPERYVRRALGRTLFESGKFRRSLTGDAPTLDVELLDFEEVKTAAAHAARVAVHVVLASDRVLLERTIVVSQPVVGDSFEDFVAAMAGALDDMADDVLRAAQVETGCR